MSDGELDGGDPAPMTDLAVTADALWAVRAGDGALPQNLLVRIDPGTDHSSR